MRRPPSELADRLRAASGDVLAHGGAPSVDEMAEAAGVPRTTLYYYFSGREALLDFLLLDKVEQIGVAVGAAAGGHDTASEGLESLLSAAVRTIAAYPVLCTMLLARLAVTSTEDALHASVERAVLRPLRDLLEAGVAEAAFELDDAEVTAYALYGAVSMAALSRLARDGRIDADLLVASLVPQLVKSVRATTITPRRRGRRG